MLISSLSSFLAAAGFRLLSLSLFIAILWMAPFGTAKAQLLEGRNKLKTVEAKPEKQGFFLFQKKGKSSPNAGSISKRERKVDIRTTKAPKNNIRQGANYNTTGGGVSIDNAPKSKPRYSEPQKAPRRKSKVGYRSKSRKAGEKGKRLPMIRFSPKIGIYNPYSPNPRYSRNPGFDRTKRYAASPRYSVPQPRVSPQSVSPRYSQSQGFVVKKGGYVIGFKKTAGLFPIAKAGPRNSKAQKTVSPSSVSPRYSQSQGFVTNKSKWVFGFKKTQGILPIAKAGPRYSKAQKTVSPSSVSPRYSKDRGIEPPSSVSPRYSQSQGFVTNKSKWVFGFKKTPGLFPIAKAGARYSKAQKIVSPSSVSPRYSKDRGIEPPSSVSPRYSQSPGFVVKKGGWVFGFSKTAGFLPIAKAGPRNSKETGFYRPGSGVNRSVSEDARQFTLPPKENRRDNNYNPLVSSQVPVVTTMRWQRNYRKDINEWITGWQGDQNRVSEFAQKLQDKGFALMYSDYTGGYKIKRGKGDSHPSIAYISGKKINSRKLRREWREFNIVMVRITGNKEVAEGVKNGPDKPKYDKKEREIWNY